jgi:hypothetical protein
MATGEFLSLGSFKCKNNNSSAAFPSRDKVKVFSLLLQYFYRRSGGTRLS